MRNESTVRDDVVSVQLTVSIHSQKHWDTTKTEFGIKAQPCYKEQGTLEVLKHLSVTMISDKE